MTKEAILLHFETIFACEPQLISQELYVFFKCLPQPLATATPPTTMTDGLNMQG